MGELCAEYWLPLYSFLRRSGLPEEESEDTLQAFFLSVVEHDVLQHAHAPRGRFRSFLIASLKNFLANQRRHAQARKRRPEDALLSLDDGEAEHGYRAVPCASLTPDETYERAWSVAMIERAIGSLRGAGEDPSREVVVAFALGSGESRSYREAAAEIGVTEAALKVRVGRMRKRFGRVLRELVAETVSREELVDRELRHLLELWGQSGA